MNLITNQENLAKLAVVLFMALMFSVSLALGQVMPGKINGVIADNGQIQPDITVIIKQDGVPFKQTKTNEEGQYSFDQLEPGIYEVAAWKEGLELGNRDVTVVSGNSIALSIDIKEVTPGEVVVYGDVDIPAFDMDETVRAIPVSLVQMKNSGIRTPDDAAVAFGNVDRNNGQLNIRGGRGNATQYFIDGQKIQGPPSIPRAAMSEVLVVTGGIPAQYGDVIGGIISVTTRNMGMKPLLATDWDRAKYAERMARKAERKKAKGKKNSSKDKELEESNLSPFSDFYLALGY